MKNNVACPYLQDLPAYLQNELDGAQARHLCEHMAHCPTCAQAAEEFQAMLHRLGSDPDAPCDRDLTEDILHRLPGVAIPWGRWLRAAALWAVLLGVGLVAGRHGLRHSAPATTAAAPHTHRQVTEQAVDWLRHAQEPDGRWDTARWGAQKMYGPGITALALLALLNESATPSDTPSDDTVEKGLRYLVSIQAPDGRFGTLCSGTPYNQGLATLALLEADAQQPRPEWKEALRLALGYIVNTQQPGGGWGYPREAPDRSNSSITVWQVQALIRARQLGHTDLREHIEKGLAWLSKLTDPEGRVGYSRARDFPYGHETLTAAGALCMLKADADDALRHPERVQALHNAAQQNGRIDYYRYYFLTRALAAEGREPSLQLLSDLQTQLTQAQNREGEHSGSWEPGDRWSSAGGRVYTTAMAVLSLK